MKGFNRASVVDGLRSYLGIVGDFGLTLEEIIRPSMPITQALDETPFANVYNSVGSGASVNASAAKNGYVACVPGAAAILQVTDIIITNEDAAAQEYVVRVMTGANITTTGLATTGFMANQAARKAGQSVGSELFRGTFNGVVGTTVYPGLVFVPPLSSLVVSLGKPGVALFGNDEGGRPALAVIMLTQNKAATANFQGREWPLG